MTVFLKDCITNQTQYWHKMSRNLPIINNYLLSAEEILLFTKNELNLTNMHAAVAMDFQYCSIHAHCNRSANQCLIIKTNQLFVLTIFAHLNMRHC